MVENASMGDDICGEVVEIVDGAGEAREPMADLTQKTVAMAHLTQKMPSNPKTRPTCRSLEEGRDNGGRGFENQ